MNSKDKIVRRKSKDKYQAKYRMYIREIYFSEENL
jgi:hypothetical protein